MSLPFMVRKAFDVLVTVMLGVLVLGLSIAAFAIGALIYFLLYAHGAV
jgi:hypothetical protein